MMKKLLISTALSLGLLGASCSTVQNTLTPAFETAVIAAADQICGFVPDVESIAAMIVVVPMVVDNVANAICQDVKNLTPAPAPTPAPASTVHSAHALGHKLGAISSHVCLPSDKNGVVVCGVYVK
jgi:hypothetical protein